MKIPDIVLQALRI